MGPLFYHDLVRLARRGRSTLLRCVYGLFLLLALYAVYQQYFPLEPLLSSPFKSSPTLDPNELAGFSANFAVALIALQTLAVVVLTPAYLAGAVAEERERRTLDLLFTTSLTDRDIILGKLFGRLCHLGGILLTAFPILSLMQLWGGADWFVLLGGATIVVFTLLSVGCLSILCSVLANDSLQAVVVSYLTVFLFSLGSLAFGCTFLSPISIVLSLEEHVGAGFLYSAILGGFSTSRPGVGPQTHFVAMLIPYAGFHGLIALCCGGTAVSSLRGKPQPPPWRPPNLWESEAAGEAPVVTGGWDGDPSPALPLSRKTRNSLHPVTDSALLWKEVYLGAGALAAWPFLGVYGCGLGLICIVWFFAILLNLQMVVLKSSFAEGMAELARDSINPVLRGAGLILASWWCLVVVLKAAGSITRERERRTLAGLLMLPAGREAVLTAKWLGGPLRFRWLGYLLAGIWSAGLLTGALHPAALVLLAAAAAIHVAFMASLGVWLSLASRNTLWAYLSAALMILVVFASPTVWAAYSEWLGGSPADESWWNSFIQTGLNPPRAWWFLAFSWSEFPDAVWKEGKLDQTFGATLAGLGVYALLAGILWLAAFQRFRREQPAGG